MNDLIERLTAQALQAIDADGFFITDVVMRPTGEQLHNEIRRHRARIVSTISPYWSGQHVFATDELVRTARVVARHRALALLSVEDRLLYLDEDEDEDEDEDD